MSQQPVTRGALVALGLALVVFAAFSHFKVPVVLPVWLADYGYSRVLAGGFMSIFAVFGILLSVPIGRTIARRGALPVSLAALPLMALGSVLCLVTPQSGAVMLAGRGLEGAAYAILAVVGPTLATANAAARHRALVIGLVSAWIPCGQLLAALLGPLALDTGGWRSLWGACLVLAGLLAAWTFHAMTRGPRGAIPRPTAPASPAQAWSRAQWTALLLTGSVFMLWSGQYLAYMTWLPVYLVEQQGLSLAGAAGGYLLPVVLVGIFNLATGFLLQRGWRAQRLLCGAVMVQAGLWWLLPVTGSGLGGILSLAAYGITSGIAPTCLFALSAQLVTTSETARAFGVTMTGRNLGVLGGPLLLALAVEESGGWTAGALLFGGLTTIAAGLCAGLLFMVPLAERRRPQPAAATADQPS